MRHGTWQETGGGGSPGLVLLIVCAVLLLGSGVTVAAVSAALVDALIAVAVVVLLTVAAVAVLVVRHARDPSPEGFVRRIVPAPHRYELPGPERPAIGPPQHLHLHFDGADPAAVAEILRRDLRIVQGGESHARLPDRRVRRAGRRAHRRAHRVAANRRVAETATGLTAVMPAPRHFPRVAGHCHYAPALPSSSRSRACWAATHSAGSMPRSISASKSMAASAPITAATRQLTTTVPTPSKSPACAAPRIASASRQASAFSLLISATMTRRPSRTT